MRAEQLWAQITPHEYWILKFTYYPKQKFCKGFEFWSKFADTLQFSTVASKICGAETGKTERFGSSIIQSFFRLTYFFINTNRAPGKRDDSGVGFFTGNLGAGQFFNPKDGVKFIIPKLTLAAGVLCNYAPYQKTLWNMHLPEWRIWGAHSEGGYIQCNGGGGFILWASDFFLCQHIPARNNFFCELKPQHRLRL